MSTLTERTSRLRVAVLGSGMSGILAAIRLRQAGTYDVVVYEKADRPGGTWRENTYPGLTCDTPIHAYTYSFEPNPDWSSYLAPGPEIQRYFENVAARHGVYDMVRFNQEITSCAWRDGRWHLRTATGLHDTADVVIAATGVLHHINMPQIPGLDTFEGPYFHSARWNHSVPLEGQRVGVIGNGSTGVQIVIALAGKASRVVHVQRTPQWIMPMPNTPYTDEQRAAFRANPKLIDDIRYGEEYVGLVRRFTAAIADKNSPEIAQIEAATLKNLEDNVHDPVLREKLRPTYRAACKRLIFSSEYYPAVQRPDVDVAVGGIERIEPKGIRMRDGTLHEVDVLALATGFKADRFVRPTKVLGQDGVDLDNTWAVRPSAYLGVAIPGYPNFFMLNGPSSPVGNFPLIDIAERQWGYIEGLLAGLAPGRAIALKPSVMQDYETRRIAAAKNTIFGSGCSSWYLDSEGIPASWPWSYDAFAQQTRAPVPQEFERIA